MKLVLVTGMSGAGRGAALKALEDCGFEAIDNLPLALLPAVAAAGSDKRGLAVGIDSRGRDFSVAHLRDTLGSLSDTIDCKILFLDCDDEILRRRFSETRRRHPLALDRTIPDGIHYERELIESVRALADQVIDTSETSVADLRRLVTAQFGQEKRALALTLTSFSYKHGLPREADIVFDVRFLANPHYDVQLRNLTGRDPDVGAYIERDEVFAPFFKHLCELLEPLLPRYLYEGKQYLTIAIGCTGERHRSVYTVQKLCDFLSAKGYSLSIRHRDLDPA